ncbi:MAG: hypothetical protein QHJ73_08270, partial [Armatimonadota bacterium]|nr:hypothetical protein [Armatimonadota bacterium]
VRERVVRNGKPGWQMRVVPLGEGFVDWDTALRLLAEMGFDGPISFHSEYSGYPVETVIDLARIDLRFIRGKGIIQI